MSPTSLCAGITLFSCSLVLTASAARAQDTVWPAPASATPSPAVPSTPSPPPTVSANQGDSEDSSRQAAALDPNLDRGFLLPTGMTQPAGSLTYSNYELLLHGITYGITDRVQAGLTILPPYVEHMPFVGTLSLKARVVSTARFHLAGQASTTFASESSNSATLVSLGILPSICLTEGCESLLSASATWVHVNGASAIMYGGSVLAKVSEHAKLVAEVVSAAGGQDEYEQSPVALFNYGVRFHAGNFAGDVGLIRPFGGGAGNEFVLGFPFVNFSYRKL
jgi:hypothetical protein